MEVIKRLSRVFAVALLATVVALALAGCENFSQGPMAVKRDGSHLLIAVCANVTVTKISGDYKNPYTDSAYTTFVEGSGSRSFKAGEVISTGERWSGMKLSTLNDPDVTAGNNLEVVLSTVPEADGFASAFKLTGSGLSDKTWQHPDGTTSVEPCG
jgi:hypothetical protein